MAIWRRILATQNRFLIALGIAPAILSTIGLLLFAIPGAPSNLVNGALWLLVTHGGYVGAPFWLMAIGGFPWQVLVMEWALVALFTPTQFGPAYLWLARRQRARAAASP